MESRYGKKMWREGEGEGEGEENPRQQTHSFSPKKGINATRHEALVCPCKLVQDIERLSSVLQLYSYLLPALAWGDQV